MLIRRSTTAMLLLAASSLHAQEVPWKTNTPIIDVKREVFMTHPRPGHATFTKVWPAGDKGQILEQRGLENRDDVPNEILTRVLESARGPLTMFRREAPVMNTFEGVEVWQGGGAKVFDPASGRMVEAWLRQIQVGDRYNCFTYIRTSTDLGNNWDEPLQLKYEPGPDFNATKPLDPAFLEKNQGYFGSNILILKDGTLMHVLAHANAPGDPGNNSRAWRMGSVVFLGRWNPAKNQYDWSVGARTEISPDVSSRGLMEPEAAQLSDGRVLIVWRGSDTPQTPGRKWMSLSIDGGRTLTEPEEWKYDDDTRFYSPSSYHRMFRHSVTGRLYWIGNICPDPPKANSPRYPLVIGEIDEAKAAIRRSTLSVIDDRQPGQREEIQFSNFSFIENVETHEIEMYMTLYGEFPDHYLSADCYKYTIKLR